MSNLALGAIVVLGLLTISVVVHMIGVVVEKDNSLEDWFRTKSKKQIEMEIKRDRLQGIISMAENPKCSNVICRKDLIEATRSKLKDAETYIEIYKEDTQKCKLNELYTMLQKEMRKTNNI